MGALFFFGLAMKSASVADIVGIINGFAPFRLAEEWDAVGLQLGDPAAAVLRAMVALDPRPAAIQAAIAAGCQLLVVHHPLLFKPLKKLVASDPIGKLVMTALRHDLAVIAMHTNYDIAREGLNDLLAARLELQDCQVLKTCGSDELLKLVVFVPATHTESLLTSLFRHGATIGNYRDCSFRVAGTGTFTPQAGANPHIGVVGIREEVAEERLELLVSQRELAAAIKTLQAAHPYEEPAFDIYPLRNRGEEFGLGRIGRLVDPAPLVEVARFVGQALQTPVRYCGDPQRLVRKVAVCSGSGASLLREAQFRGADLLITGDLKHHDATEAELLGLALVDAGHFGTEILMVEGVAARLRQTCGERGLATEVLVHGAEQPLFQWETGQDQHGVLNK